MAAPRTDPNYFIFSERVDLSEEDLLARIAEAPASVGIPFFAVFKKGEHVTDTVLEFMAARFYRTLYGVDLRGCRKLTDTGIKTLAHMCRGPVFRRLNCNGCHNLTGAAAINLAESCPNLQNVNFHGCGITLPLRPGGAPTQMFDDTVVTALATSCPALEQIVFPTKSQVTKAGWLALANGCSQLKEVSLGEIRDLTNDAFRILIENNCNLNRIHLTGCVELTDDAVELLAKTCHNLKVINILPTYILRSQGGTASAEDIAAGKLKLTHRSVVALATHCKKIKKARIMFVDRRPYRSPAANVFVYPESDAGTTFAQDLWDKFRLSADGRDPSETFLRPPHVNYFPSHLTKKARVAPPTVAPKRDGREDVQAGPGSNDLPFGWEEMRTSRGRPYYVSHALKDTQWEDPRLAAGQLPGKKGPSSTEGAFAHPRELARAAPPPPPGESSAEAAFAHLAL